MVPLLVTRTCLCHNLPSSWACFVTSQRLDPGSHKLPKHPLLAYADVLAALSNDCQLSLGLAAYSQIDPNEEFLRMVVEQVRCLACGHHMPRVCLFVCMFACMHASQPKDLAADNQNFCAQRMSDLRMRERNGSHGSTSHSSF
jgi:hypothetical protein